MKPDKHKQKRTQQYKKKHGIKDDSESKDEKSTAKNRGKLEGQTGSQSGSGTQQQRHGQRLHDGPGTSKDGTHVKTQRHSHMPGTGNSSDSSEEESVRRAFRHREVASNWEKYTGEEDLPETVEQRGADFTALLAAASGALSQFRFEDEKSWEDDLSSTADLGAFLSIDTNELAAALDCIPLHKTLNIEEAAFELEDIKLFEQEAAMNRKLYLEAREEKEETAPPPAATNMEGLSRIWNQPDGDILDELNQDLEVAMKTSHVLNIGNGFETRELGFDRTGIEQEETGCPLDSNNIEEDLDKLLSFSEQIPSKSSESVNEFELNDVLSKSDQVKSELGEQNLKKNEEEPKATKYNFVKEQKNVLTEQTNMQKKKPEMKSVPLTNLEDELDKLLLMDGDVKPETVTSNDAAVDTKTNDLEDWLDSVLDD